ncbi:MAG: hypothetical protein KAS12_00185, partial [Candidatus Aenigmarchaeota archaeon]|nr:hypothetical protein [Candidatus Aenigmarchaeota archaeon]
MRKAISPLITMVLIIVFTITIGSMTVNWMLDYTKTTTSSVTESTTGVKGITYCANSNVEISNVALKNIPIISNTSILSGTTNEFNVSS